MSWRFNDKNREDYSVFFNRDEDKARPVGIPPQEFLTKSGIRYLAPIDPQGGGTWMLANERGIVVTLLNWYDKDVPEPRDEKRFRSRGLLVKGLADVISSGELESRMKSEELKEYPPFHLLGFAPGEPVFQMNWDGNAPRFLERNESDSIPVMSSSSFESGEVLKARNETFCNRERADLESFEAFQSNDGEDSTAFTPRMNRPDAQTWSRSRVDVSADRLDFKYIAEAPDLAGEGKLFEAYLHRS
jgi:uncharacterized protein with NRDE domain